MQCSATLYSKGAAERVKRGNIWALICCVEQTGQKGLRTLLLLARTRKFFPPGSSVLRGEKVFWKMVALNGAMCEPLFRVPRRIIPRGWTQPLSFALSSAHLKAVDERPENQESRNVFRLWGFSPHGIVVAHVCRRMTKDSSSELKEWWFWMFITTTHMGLHPWEGRQARQGAKVHLTPTAEKRAKKP